MSSVLRAMVLLATLGFALSNSGASSLEESLLGGAAEAGIGLEPGAVPLLTVDDEDGNHGMWGDWDGWAWWLFMPMILVFWGGVIWLIVWLVRQSSGGTGSRDNDPVEIARRRYARGEISRDEFEQIRRDLSG